jgi:hypothetical protein
MKKMLTNGNVVNTKITAKDVDKSAEILGPCPSCIKGKITAPTQAKESGTPPKDRIGDLVHTDIMYFNDNMYLISSDDKTNFLYLNQMKDKNRNRNTIETAIQHVIELYMYAKHNWNMKEFRSDQEPALMVIRDRLGQQGIKYTNSHTEEHNGSIERMIRNEMSKTRSEQF